MANNNDNIGPGGAQVLRPHPDDVWIFQLRKHCSRVVIPKIERDLFKMKVDLGLKGVILLPEHIAHLTVKREPLTVIEEVAAEREKQVSKGYDAKHDDTHDDQSLTLVAAYLAIPCTSGVPIPAPDWGLELEESHGERDCLIIAAALIIAEVERMDRAETDDVQVMPCASPCGAYELESAVRAMLADPVIAHGDADSMALDHLTVLRKCIKDLDNA